MLSYSSGLLWPRDGIPVLNKVLDFGKWNKKVLLFLYDVFDLNSSVDILFVASTALAALRSSVSCGSFSEEEFTVQWMKKKNEILESLGVKIKKEKVEGSDSVDIIKVIHKDFIKFVRTELRDDITSAVENQIDEWKTSQSTKKEILEEALFFSEFSTTHRILKGLSNCDKNSLEHVIQSVGEVSVQTVVDALKKYYIRKSLLQTQPELDKPFNNNIVSNINFKKVKCFKCGKMGHFAKNCRTKKKPKHMKKSVSKINKQNDHVPTYVNDFIIEIVIGGFSTKALVDTGANISLIKESLVHKIEFIDFKKGETHGESANGSAINISGSSVIEVSINGRKLTGFFYISNNITYDVILGLDFLEKNNIEIKYKPRRVIVNNVHFNCPPSYSNLLEEFRHLFVDNIGDNGGKARVDPVEIKLEPNAKPVYQRNYRMSQEEKDALEKEVEKMLENSVIEEVSPDSASKGWNSPVILIRKKDGSWRLCIDFRKLNIVTLKVAALLPRVEDIVEEVARKKVFSVLDLASGYWQIPVSKECRSLLRFESLNRQYQFKVLPFGVTNAPAIFQRLINDILKGIDNVHTLIDDTITASLNIEEDVIKLREIFRRLDYYHLRLNKKKCKFGETTLNIFGFTIKNGKISIDENRVKAIEDIPTPKDENSLQSFLGSTNYYRKFIRNYAELESKIRKAFINDNKAFESHINDMKNALKRLPELYAFDGTREIEIHTDASNRAVSGVLMQKIGNNLCPVAYYSRILQDPETRYATIEKELVAVHESIKKFRPYIAYKKFTLKTDHKPLISILKHGLNPFGARWNRRLLRMSEFDFDVVHIPGKENKVADYLSRNINAISVTFPSMSKAQELDPTVLEIVKKDKRVVKENDVYTIVLKDGRQVIILPVALRLKAIEESHKDEFGGHFGVKKTFRSIANRFYWNNMYTDVEQYIKRCHTCSLFKEQKTKPIASQHLQKASVWTNLAIDFMGPFTVSDTQKHVLVVVDMFSKYIETKVVNNTSSVTVIKAIHEIFLRHGIPRTLLSDNASYFSSESFKNYLAKLNIKIKKSSPYNPQGNGVVERMIRTLKNTLRKLLNEGKVFEEAVYSATAAYNSSLNATTGFSPYMILHGREKRLPLDNITNFIEESKPEEYIQILNQELPRIYDVVKMNIKLKEEKQDETLEFSRKLGNTSFEVGEKVLVYNEKRTTLEPRYQGPFLIKEKISQNSYIVEGFDKPVNIRRLNKFFPKSEGPTVTLENVDKTEVDSNQVEGTLEYRNSETQEEEYFSESSDTSGSYKSINDNDIEQRKDELKRLSKYAAINNKWRDLDDYISINLRSGRSTLKKHLRQKDIDKAMEFIDELKEEQFL